MTTRAVVDEKVRPIARRDDVDPVRAWPLGHHARDDWHLGLVEAVRKALDGDGLDAG